MNERIVALTADLMFSSNIESTLQRAGHDVTSVEDLTALQQELDAGDVGLLILDLHAGVEAEDIVALCSGPGTGREPQPGESASRGVPVLAFGRHTEPVLLRSAREAGCTEVVPRSTFVEQMPQLVQNAIRRD